MDYKNSIAMYKGTKNLYKILSSECKMKNPETREWQPAVIYQGYKLLKDGEYIDDPEGKIWVREFTEFNEKFELTINLWN